MHFVVDTLVFTEDQRKWLREHDGENYKAPDDATPLEKQRFFCAVWTRFCVAFPDSRAAGNSTGGSDSFEQYVWGKVRFTLSAGSLVHLDLTSKLSMLRGTRDGLGKERVVVIPNLSMHMSGCIRHSVAQQNATHDILRRL